jgi:hypothetical protein
LYTSPFEKKCAILYIKEVLECKLLSLIDLDLEKENQELFGMIIGSYNQDQKNEFQGFFTRAENQLIQRLKTFN